MRFFFSSRYRLYYRFTSFSSTPQYLPLTHPVHEKALVVVEEGIFIVVCDFGVDEEKQKDFYLIFALVVDSADGVQVTRLELHHLLAHLSEVELAHFGVLGEVSLVEAPLVIFFVLMVIQQHQTLLETYNTHPVTFVLHLVDLYQLDDDARQPPVHQLQQRRPQLVQTSQQLVHELPPLRFRVSNAIGKELTQTRCIFVLFGAYAFMVCSNLLHQFWIFYSEVPA
jgi:competence protein ComGC